MKSSTKVAVAGVFSAMYIVLMFVGGLLSVTTYAIPMILGVFSYCIFKTFGAKTAFFIYAAVSILSVLLLSNKECALMFALNFGYYPLLKNALDKLRPKALQWLVKLLIFNISVAAIEAICVYLFHIPFFENERFSLAFLIAYALLMNVVFVLFDLFLGVFIKIYELRLEGKIKKLFKY